MAIRLTITARHEDAQRRLQAAQAAGQDLRPPLRAIALAGVTQSRKRFATKRGPDGAAWIPSKKKTGETGTLSGILRGNGIQAGEPDGASVSWGSNRVYAGRFQTGANKAEPVAAHERTVKSLFGKRLKAPLTFSVKGHVRKLSQPPRPYLGVNADDGAEFVEILVRHLGDPLWMAV